MIPTVHKINLSLFVIITIMFLVKFLAVMYHESIAEAKVQWAYIIWEKWFERIFFIHLSFTIYMQQYIRELQNIYFSTSR